MKGNNDETGKIVISSTDATPCLILLQHILQR